MPRNKYKRIIGALPEIDGFLPMGVDAGRAEKIELHVEEYEVIRLLDYLGYTQDEASKEMLVSRPTVTRIYEQARKKVAKALIEGRELTIIGGDYQFGSAIKCPRCNLSVNENCKCCEKSRTYTNKFRVCRFCQNKVS